MPRRTAIGSATAAAGWRGFNEAGAKCPGEPGLRLRKLITTLPASMRPGRNAPENVEVDCIRVRDRAGFNEAGAKCPGERPRGIHDSGLSQPLQ